MSDLSTVSIDKIDEIHRQGELCLLGTIQLAIAADQKATTLSGVFGAGSVALLAAIATMITGPTYNVAFIVAAGIASVLLFLATLICAMAARPTDFFIAGYEPKRLGQSQGDKLTMLRFAAEDIQDRLDKNRMALEKSAKLLVRGFWCALLAVPAAILAFSITWFLVNYHLS
jgi:hypothetical protein